MIARDAVALDNLRRAIEKVDEAIQTVRSILDECHHEAFCGWWMSYEELLASREKALSYMAILRAKATAR